jgi:hypothetical protein
MFEDRVLWKMYERKRGEITGDGEKFIMRSFKQYIPILPSMQQLFISI